MPSSHNKICSFPPKVVRMAMLGPIFMASPCYFSLSVAALCVFVKRELIQSQAEDEMSGLVRTSAGLMAKVGKTCDGG